MAIRLARAAIRGLLRFAANPLNAVGGGGSVELEVKGVQFGEEILLVDNDDDGGGKGAVVSVPAEVG